MGAADTGDFTVMRCPVSLKGRQARVNILGSSSMYVCMYVWSSHIAEYMDQPGKVANPARGQLNRENEHSPVPVRA